MTLNGYDHSAAIMKALAHPVRLQILAVLAREESCVCHLEAHLGQRQAAISQHLMRLRDAGLVRDRREGLNVYYRLADAAIPALLAALHTTADRVAGAGLSYDLPLADSCPCPRCALAEEDAA